jgi:hypothetical protein
MKHLHKTEPWCSALEIGAVIWRPVQFSSIAESIAKSCRLIHAKSIFKPAPKGGFMCRMATPGCFIPELELIPAQTRTGKARSGLVVFVPHMPDSGWTHLMITGLTAQLRDKACSEHGGALHAAIATPFEMDDYTEFRVNMLMAMMLLARGYEGESLAEAQIAAAEDIWPTKDDEPREGLLRLLIAATHDPSMPWAYSPVQDEADDDDEGDEVEEEDAGPVTADSVSREAGE